LKLLKGVLLALLFSLLVGLAIGTALRMRLERPTPYIGSAFAPDPFDVGESRPAAVLSRHPRIALDKIASDRSF
jgi:hypothetical protein